MFEITVDVRWFVALAERKLEQQVGPVRVQLGDAEGETLRIGRRAAALAKDFPAPGEGDDVLHGEEIALIAQFGDQLEFSLICLRTWVRAVRPAPGDALFGEMAELKRRTKNAW